jgi:dienelactone hydrolase
MHPKPMVDAAAMHRTLALVLALSSPAFAAVVQKTIAYEVNKTPLEGVLIYDDSTKAARAGLVMVPSWMGINAANLEQAKLIAGTKYVVFVADMYGKAVRPKNSDEAGKAAGAVKGDPALMRARVAAAYDTLKAQKLSVLDAKRLGAVGFCFGGTAVLELARSGSPVTAVVSIHGGIGPLKGAEPTKEVKAHVLALHGADDPFVPAKDVEAFESELRAAKADWELVKYANSVHAFTDPEANSPGQAQYNALTAKRAYAAMNAFFDELLQ